ncbi:MAG: thermonuclease family protein [Alphaproteobacteria bacterium]|nr:thermonuclease family protein [Alphaproteobacteria bacterium]
MLRLRFVIWLLICLPGTAHAEVPQDLFGALDHGPRAVVTDVVDGDTVVLDNGREVRLVGIQAPKLPLGRPGFEKWPLADASKAALEKLVLGRTVTLAYGGARVDRYNRLLAHLFTEDGTWIQGRLLGDGMARVYSFPDNRALVHEMLAREGHAREARDGIWALPYYVVLDTEASAAHVDRFALVEGRVLETARVRGRTFLNFGPDWRTDFTIAISAKNWKSFAAQGISHEDYAGRRVRVRGWLKSRNGPMIDVTHPEQIEVLTQ